MTDSYTIYSEWFLHHYGRPFACTREQWREWCARPRIAEDVRGRDLDAEREAREGWHGFRS